MYSIAIVKQLFSDGNNPFNYVEKSHEVLTLTNGEYTLEFAGLCPPYCPD